MSGLLDDEEERTRRLREIAMGQAYLAQRMNPERPLALDPRGLTLEEPGAGFDASVMQRSPGGTPMTMGGGQIGAAIPVGDGGLLGASIGGGGVLPQRGRAQVQPSDASVYYQPSENARYSLDYSQQPQFADPRQMSRELMLRGMWRF
jgi:hypothetical protein